MGNCLACLCNVESSGNRRVLHSPSTSHLVPILRSIFEEHFCLNDVAHAVPLAAVSDMVYVCKKRG